MKEHKETTSKNEIKFMEKQIRELELSVVIFLIEKQYVKHICSEILEKIKMKITIKYYFLEQVLLLFLDLLLEHNILVNGF